MLLQACIFYIPVILPSFSQFFDGNSRKGIQLDDEYCLEVLSCFSSVDRYVV
jgi:hypothetical protein